MRAANFKLSRYVKGIAINSRYFLKVNVCKELPSFVIYSRWALKG